MLTLGAAMGSRATCGRWRSPEPVLGLKWTRVRVEHGRPVRATADGEPVPVVDWVGGRCACDGRCPLRVADPDADRAISVDVRWAEAGYPSRIAFDYSDAIDDEVTFKVIRFEPLER